ncbi:alanine-phosphoribitol ligase [Paenibacillus sambharensis]|uniref:Alanine-phosphoribitol ligase n=1 Tax=Paenibacillus sambharensis TaxID=1803190 RepID=A0A2W1LDD4_9BACL|nr:phosphopantetheine-binding protein [Paenibacillus sambharensis]PZD96813.1 alanine-phosphoribitol ligase [Paenibacillus sambharensis]
MLTETVFFDTVRQVCGRDDIGMSTAFTDLDIDSTQVIELLIEFEIVLNIDVLDDRLNLDEMRTFQDVYDYLAHLMSN